MIRRIARQIKRLVLPSKRPKQELPRKYVETLRNLEACTGSLNGKRLLEVGADRDGMFLRYLNSERGIHSAIGVNPCVREEIEDGQISVRNIDARSMPFPENDFDVVSSISVFEHVQDLDVALGEIHRVLRPGGYLFAEFGPIWSSSWGHHLWFDRANETINWRTHPLPPFAHLLMSEPELLAWCESKYGDGDLAKEIVEFVYWSPDQNRLMYSDYDRIVRESPFETVFFVGIPEVPFPDDYVCEDTGKTFRALNEKYPDETGFGHHVIRALLQKR